MAAGKVVMTTDVGGHAEMIDEETGILIQAKSKNEVIRGLSQFLKMTEEQRIHMGERARARMIALGDYNHNAALLMDLFHQLVK